MIRQTAIIVGAAFVLMTSGWLTGCGEETPSRNHIPVLQQRLYQLQEAIKSKSRASIDSLLSIQILDNNQDSDSLLALIYGPDGDFAFERLGNYEIFYTQGKARIDCYIMDSASLSDRPLTLTLVHEHEMWLLKRFDPGLPKPTPVDE